MNSYALYIILISGAVTILLRFLPFIAFSRSCPKFIIYLGRVLPYSVMAMLVIYCLRESHGVKEMAACLIVILLQIWKRSTLLSITAGTVIYMLMIQYL